MGGGPEMQRRGMADQEAAVRTLGLGWNQAAGGAVLSHTVGFCFFVCVYMCGIAANQLHIKILIPSLWQTLKDLIAQGPSFP